MRYSGSKQRYAKALSSIILKKIQPNQCYIEPFSGGCNMFSYIDHPNKIAADSNEYVVELWKDIQNQTFVPPSELSQEEYNAIKNDYMNKTNIYPKSLIGYVGNSCSFGGAWFNGYARFNPNKNNGKGEDHIAEAASGLTKQIKSFKYLNNSKFIHGSYDEIELPPNSVLYLDPPYASTKGYENNFDSDKFWGWCREKSKEGHKLYISEYTAPTDFRCVWRAKKKDGMGTTKKGIKQNTKIEKLFVYKG